MATVIIPERPDSPAASQLIAELEAHLAPRYPQESRHGYSVGKLLGEGVAFFVVWHHEAAAGCGGVQLYGRAYGELKRMYIRPQFRGLGLAKILLNHLAAYTRQQGAALLRLETGVYQEAAIGLYERFGFQRIPPFGDYREDPLSLFYELRLDPQL
jgi:GNAT superfamily N-acetyltransferase